MLFIKRESKELDKIKQEAKPVNADPVDELTKFYGCWSDFKCSSSPICGANLIEFLSRKLLVMSNTVFHPHHLRSNKPRIASHRQLKYTEEVPKLPRALTSNTTLKKKDERRKREKKIKSNIQNTHRRRNKQQNRLLIHDPTCQLKCSSELKKLWLQIQCQIISTEWLVYRQELKRHFPKSLMITRNIARFDTIKRNLRGFFFVLLHSFGLFVSVHTKLRKQLD